MLSFGPSACLPDVAEALFKGGCAGTENITKPPIGHAEGLVRDSRSEGGPRADRFGVGRDAGTRCRGMRPGEKQRRATQAVRRFKVLSSRPRKQGVRCR